MREEWFEEKNPTQFDQHIILDEQLSKRKTSPWRGDNAAHHLGLFVTLRLCSES
jgi:hypothetical protein